MKARTRHYLLWGWLRLLLGFGQIALATSAIFSFANHGGANQAGLGFILLAGVLSLISRLLYKGHSDPNVFK